MCAVLIPSMLMEPPANSTSRKSATPRDDFPKDNKWVWDTRQKAAAAAAVEQKNPSAQTWSCTTHDANGLLGLHSERQVF